MIRITKGSTVLPLVFLEAGKLPRHIVTDDVNGRGSFGFMANIKMCLFNS